MAQLPYDVRRAPTPQLAQDPALVAQLLRAREANQELEGMQPRLADARAAAQYQGPRGRQSGGNFVAASPLEFLGSLFQSGVGQSKYDKLQQQAQALRGETAQGPSALEAQERARAQAQQKAIDDRAFTQAQNAASRDAWLAEQDKLKREELARQKMLATKKASGRPPTGTEMKTYRESGRLLGVIDELDGLYNAMSDADKASVDAAFTETALNILPSGIKNLAKEQLFSGPVKEYQTRVARLESKLSQLASGLAVTGYEMKDRKNWSPNAEGITQAERQRRLANIQNDLMGEIGTHHQVYGTAHIQNPFGEPQPPAPPPAQPVVPAPQPAAPQPQQGGSPQPQPTAGAAPPQPPPQIKFLGFEE